MAKADAWDNPLLKGFRGRLMGMFVVKQMADGSIQLSGRPRRSSTPPSEAQLAQRERFKTATAYARAMRTHEVYIRAAKKLPGKSPYNVAVQDFLVPPDIVGIKFDSFAPKTGGEIRVAVASLVDIERVSLTLLDVTDPDTPIALYESEMVQALPGDIWWQDTVHEGLPSVSISIQIDAHDLAGNITEYQAVV